jgi:hypothetical protein
VRAAADRLLEANLVEDRLLAALDATSSERFSAVTSRMVLLGGSKDPDSIGGGPILDEIAAAKFIILRRLASSIWSGGLPRHWGRQKGSWQHPSESPVSDRRAAAQPVALMRSSASSALRGH